MGWKRRTSLGPCWSSEDHWWAWTPALGILLPAPLTLWIFPSPMPRPPGSQEYPPPGTVIDEETEAERGVCVVHVASVRSFCRLGQH